MSARRKRSLDYVAVFGENVRLAREARDLTQVQLAARLGYSASPYISYVETGKRNITIIQAARFAEALGLPLADLFDARPRHAVS